MIEWLTLPIETTLSNGKFVWKELDMINKTIKKTFFHDIFSVLNTKKKMNPEKCKNKANEKK